MIQRLCAIIALALLATGCAVNPVTGKNEIMIYSDQAQIAMGAEQFIPGQQSQGGLYSIDPELTAYINSVGQRIAAHSDAALPYEFVVLNNSVPNAWALPGGKIAVNRGLLTELNSEAELAAVLGHEIIHAAARHGAKRIQTGLAFQTLVVTTAIASKDSQYSNYYVGGAQLITQLFGSKYGRDAEREADYYGMQYMVRAGYDPKAAVSLQETFVRLSEGRDSNWLAGWFASHPPSQERVDNNSATAEQLKVDGETGAERYQQQLARLRDRQPAYDAFDKAYREIAKGDLEAAMSLTNQAILREPKEARFHGLKGDIYLEQKRYRAARAAYDDALARDNNYYEYYLGRGLAYSQLNQRAEAKRDLEKSNTLFPTSIANNELGKMALAAGNRAVAKNYFQVAASAPDAVGKEALASFITLDLPENPARYLKANAGLSDDRRLYAQVGNQSPFIVRQLQVVFEARVNGQNIQRSVNLYNLQPGTTSTALSGWQFKAEDQVDGYRAYVTSPRL